MRQFKAGNADSPTPEQLAAYVDGELDPARRRGVETWLRNHPEAAAEIEQYQRLARLWKAAAPIEPEGAKWATVLARVESGLRSHSLPLWRSQLIRMGAAAALAAAVMLLVCRHRPEPTEGPVRGELLAVVSPDDVDILSLRAADRVTLVVGVPPVTEPLVLASPRDVELERIEPDGDGVIPDIHMDEKSDTAMIVAPRSTNSARTAER
jgi:anti-sigma-K factor RskA